MNTAEVLLRLAAHQSRILARIAESEALIALSPAVAQPALGRARWIMIRLLREYQLFKHTEVFDPVIRLGDEQQTARARRMRADCLAAGEAFAAYVAGWSGRDVTAAWDEYRAAMRAMSRTLREHIIRERAGVDALLSGLAPIRRSSLDRRIAVAISSPGRSPPAARADSRAR